MAGSLLNADRHQLAAISRRRWLLQRPQQACTPASPCPLFEPASRVHICAGPVVHAEARPEQLHRITSPTSHLHQNRMAGARREGFDMQIKLLTIGNSGEGPVADGRCRRNGNVVAASIARQRGNAHSPCCGDHPTRPLRASVADACARTRCRQDLPSAALCERLLQPDVHHHHRHRLQNQVHRHRWQEDQAAGAVWRQPCRTPDPIAAAVPTGRP